MAELSHSDRRFIRFNANAGDLKVQVSGRSKGHAIDSLHLIPTSARKTNAKGWQLPENALYEDGDLLALHFDNAPNLHDAHSNVADLMIVEHFGLRSSTLVVSGTYGDSVNSSYQSGSEAVFQATWGDEGSAGTWLNADARLAHAHSLSVARWTETLQAGNKVLIAEGGNSEFTADVLRTIAFVTPSVDLKNVFVIQSNYALQDEWEQIDYEEITFIDEVANFITVPRVGDAESMNQPNDDVANRFLGDPVYGSAWASAFSYLNPFTDKFDGTDALSLLFIMGLEEHDVKSWSDFREYFLPN